MAGPERAYTGQACTELEHVPESCVFREGGGRPRTFLEERKKKPQQWARQAGGGRAARSACREERMLSGCEQGSRLKTDGIFHASLTSDTLGGGGKLTLAEL